MPCINNFLLMLIFCFNFRLQHHHGLSGKRPESTDTDDGHDASTPPRSPAMSDTSDSDLSLGTNSPPPPPSSSTRNSQSPLSSPNHHPSPHPLHSFTSLSSMSSF